MAQTFRFGWPLVFLIVFDIDEEMEHWISAKRKMDYASFWAWRDLVEMKVWFRQLTGMLGDFTRGRRDTFWTRGVQDKDRREILSVTADVFTIASCLSCNSSYSCSLFREMTICISIY